MAHTVSKATEGDHRIYELEVPLHTLQPLAHILCFEPPLDALSERSDVIRPIKIISLTHTYPSSVSVYLGSPICLF